MPRKGERTSEETKRRISAAKKGIRPSPEVLAKFLEGKERYYEAYFRTHGHHPNKGRHPLTEFKSGNRLWVGRHHSEETKLKISRALIGTRQSYETRARKSLAHMGGTPWNKGLTRASTPSLARIGEATRRRWTPEMRRKLSERNKTFWKDWWQKHPEARATITQVSRPTSIELLARDSMARRGIPFLVSKRLEDVCYPDVILPTVRIAIFCHGCFWHACPLHSPVVPDWLRKKIKDEFVESELQKKGWRVLVVWEHEFKTNKDAAGAKLDAMLAHDSGGE